MSNETVIFKYPIDLKAGATTLFLPEDSGVVHVGVQEGVIHVWIRGSRTAPTDRRKFQIFGTGWTIPKTAKLHVGTVQVQDDAGNQFVWHVFEMGVPA